MNTNESTQVDEKHDLEDINFNNEEIQDNLIDGHILTVNIKKIPHALLVTASLIQQPNKKL